MLRAALLLLSLGLCTVGCQNPPDTATTPAKTSAKSAPKKVGYELRRLRPHDSEPLSKMFDRLLERAAADNKSVVVLFSAQWCKRCQQLENELGNMHPADKIGGFRILEIVEEDWEAAIRMDEFNTLRRRWSAPILEYPLFIVLNEHGVKVEEMREAIDRLSAAGIEPTVDNWFENLLQGKGPKAQAPSSEVEPA